MAWNCGLFLVENPRPKIQIFDFQLITKSSVASSCHGAALSRHCHCFIVPPRSGTGSELSLFRRQHRPATVNYLTLSVMPALIVSGARSMTALSSPAIQKPHLSQTPAASPAHTALLVPSVKMKLLIQQAFLKFRSRMWRRTERTANINEKVPPAGHRRNPIICRTGYYLTRIDLPMRRVVLVVIPFRAQSLLTVV